MDKNQVIDVTRKEYEKLTNELIAIRAKEKILTKQWKMYHVVPDIIENGDKEK